MAEVFNFSLERNDHLGTLATKLHSMFEQERFVDYKLFASDGRVLKVHRFILCAFSQYFEDLLNKLPENCFGALLKNVSFDDLKALVEYMYKGTITVGQQQLPSFLKAASFLQIARISIHQSHPGSDKQLQSIVQARPEVQPQMVSRNVLQSNVISTQKKTVTDDDHSARMKKKSEQGREELLFSSKVAQSKSKHPTKKTGVLFHPQTTDQGTVNGTPMLNPEQLREDWMDTSDNGDVQGNENDILSQAMKLSFIDQNVDCSIQDSDGELKDVSSTITEGKQKEIESARSILQSKKKSKMRSNPLKRFKCSNCESAYTRKENLAKHLKYDCGNKVPAFSCSMCDYQANRKIQLQKHINKIHKTHRLQPITNPFKCCKCGRSAYKLLNNLEDHWNKCETSLCT